MIFRSAKTGIEEILSENAADRFRVVGYQHQTKHADELDKRNRTVQVYYSSGEFSKSSGRVNGPTQHDMMFRLDLTVSAQAQGDVKTLKRENAMPAERSMVLDAMIQGCQVADESVDELIELIYQILMDPRNYHMGQEKGTVSNRWIDQVQKDQPEPDGERVILTASMFLKLTSAEQITGATATTTGNVQDITVDIDGDDVEKTGVKVDP